MGKRVADMTTEERERQRARHHGKNRKENMSPEQLERHRSYRRRENMTPEQLERKRSRDREYTAGVNAQKAPDLEVFMLNKIDMATRLTKFTYRIPSTCPPELAAKLSPVLEMLKTADAAQRAVIRGVVRAMRAARELELAESVAQ